MREAEEYSDEEWSYNGDRLAYPRGSALPQYLQIGAIAASLLSCIFWLLGAAVGFRPLSLFRFSGPESIPYALQRQSMLNALAAFFAAIGAACQAAVLYLGID